MLAVQRSMDMLHKATSYQDSDHSIMRQPSAEDLDAAHQLVSSARGERNGVYVPVDAERSISPEVLRDLNRESFSENEKAVQTADGVNASGLEQMCR